MDESAMTQLLANAPAAAAVLIAVWMMTKKIGESLSRIHERLDTHLERVESLLHKLIDKG